VRRLFKTYLAGGQVLQWDHLAHDRDLLYVWMMLGPNTLELEEHIDLFLGGRLVPPERIP